MQVEVFPFNREIHTSVIISVPRYFGGDNFIPAEKESTMTVLNDVEKKLLDIGISTKIDKAKLRRIYKDL